MKRSRHIELLVATSLVAAMPGCSDQHAVQPVQIQQPTVQMVAGGGDNQTFDPNRDYPDNTYIPSLGYYHASSRWWYPHPVNFFDPIQGYYYGGSWFPAPHRSTIIVISRPDPSRSFSYFASHPSGSRPVVTPSSTPSGSSGTPATSMAEGSRSHLGSISRGGFGESGGAHASS